MSVGNHFVTNGRSELVKTGPKLGQIGPHVPRNTKIPKEEASKSRYFFDKRRLHGGTPELPRATKRPQIAESRATRPLKRQSASAFCGARGLRGPSFLCHEAKFYIYWHNESGTSKSRARKKGVITKGVFSLEESLEPLPSLHSLEDGRILLCFPVSGASLESLESLESLNSLESLENGLFWKDPFSKRPLRQKGDGKKGTATKSIIDCRKMLQIVWRLPWPSNPCFFGQKKARITPKKQGFFLPKP